MNASDFTVYTCSMHLEIGLSLVSVATNALRLRH